MEYYFCSPFVYFYKRDGIYALYNSLTMDKVYFDNKKIFDLLSSKEEIDLSLIESNEEKQFLGDLIKEGFVVNDEFDSEIYIKEFIKKYEFTININTLVLLATTKCNFACTYCFFENTGNITENPEMMSFETAKKAVDLFFKLSKEKPRVIFYGGEPILNWIVVKKTIEYIKKIDENCKISINTNSSLFNSEICRFLSKNNVSLAVSIDGIETNDKARITVDKKGTYDKVLKNLDLIKKHHIPFSISCTIGKHNVREIASMPELTLKLGSKTIGFNILSPIPGRKNPEEIGIEEVVEKLIEANENAKRLGIVESRVGRRRLSRFMNNRFYLKDCAAYGNMLVAAPDGTFGPCHHFYSIKQNFIKAEKVDEIRNSDLWRVWSNRVPLLINKECAYCEAVAICGGGCAYRAFINKGKLSKIDDETCYLSKHLIDYFIWEYFDEKFNEAWENEKAS